MHFKVHAKFFSILHISSNGIPNGAYVDYLSKQNIYNASSPRNICENLIFLLILTFKRICTFIDIPISDRTYYKA